MKRTVSAIFLIFLFPFFFECGDSSTGDSNDSGTGNDTQYKQEMRLFVQRISSYGKANHPGFIVIPQNGHELLTVNGDEKGAPATDYLAAIDGVGREDLLYGYEDDNKPTPVSDINYMAAFMDIAEENSVEVLVTDYCWTISLMGDSYSRNYEKGYISFAADHRELDNIPTYPETPYNVNASDISSLKDAKNFLYLLNPGLYDTKRAFLDAIKSTDYDVVIIDLFFGGNDRLSAEELASLKTKSNGASRLVIAYMSIGEAEDSRYYWRSEWKSSPQSWLAGENPDWPGNYKVRYWNADWQKIIFGEGDSYLGLILDAGFDGVYLDIIDAYEYFENLSK